MVYGIQNNIDCRASYREVSLKDAVIAAHKRIWHGQTPDQVIVDRRYSDNSYDIRAIVLNRNDLPKVTLFHVSPDFYVSRL